MPATSPAQALGMILHGPSKTANPGIVLLDYRDPATFSALWLKGLESGELEIDGQKIDLTDSNKQFLLIGNDPPDGIFDTKIPALVGINFSSHFTATSWLAAWMVKFSDSLSRIAVIDPRPASAASGVIQALQTIFSASGPDCLTLVPGATVLNAPSLETICKWLKPEKPDTRTLAKDATHLRELLKSTVWNELTSNREQHHALSNVVGAFLLRSELGGNEMPLAAESLLFALLHASSVITRPTTNPIPWIDANLRARLGGAVLIDDMADLWAGFLRNALGFTDDDRSTDFNGITLAESIVTTPMGGFLEHIKDLPARLTDFLESNRQFLSAGDLLPGIHQVADHFVLFLDLRLFEAKSGDAKGSFYRDIAAFGVFLLDSKRHLPWLDDERKNRLRDELLSFLEETRHDDSVPRLPAETLLARLLALLDPTLPIIIFSSTHRSELIEPFRGYGNLITTFRKPVLNGMTRDWPVIVAGLKADFASALDQAAKVLQARKVFASFRKMASGSESPPTLTGQHGHLIEIFMDESELADQKAICAGGLVLIRTLGEDGGPTVSDAAIRERLINGGVQWGWCADTPTNQRVRPENIGGIRAYMPKGEDLNFEGNGMGCALLGKMVETIKSAIGDEALCFPVALIAKHSVRFPQWTKCPPGVDAKQAEKLMDSTLRHLMGLLIEALLFRCHLIRSALDHPSTRVGVDIGTRFYPCLESDVLKELFGFEIVQLPQPGKWGRSSFQSEDAYVITAEAMARTGIAWPFQGQIQRARAITLRDYGAHEFAWWNEPGKSKVLPKQLHYFADTISHVITNHLTEAAAGSDALKCFFSSGWIVDLRMHNDYDHVKIGRLWDQKNRVTAIERAARLSNPPVSNGMGMNIFDELDRGSRELTGGELMDLFRRLV
jgi:hypothetical protein